MSVLPNTRHERLARAFTQNSLDPNIGGRRALQEAARAAGYNRNTYCRDFKRPEVKERIRELMREAHRHSDIRTERLLVQLDCIANVNVKHFFDEDGRFRAFDQLSDQDACCIKKIDFNVQTGLPRRVEFHDKNRALELLLKHLRGPEIHNHQHVTLNISDEQRVAALMSLLSKADDRQIVEHQPLPTLSTSDDFVMSAEDANDES